MLAFVVDETAMRAGVLASSIELLWESGVENCILQLPMHELHRPGCFGGAGGHGRDEWTR